MEDSLIGGRAGLVGKEGLANGGRAGLGMGGDTEVPFILAKRSLRTCSFCSQVMSDMETLLLSSPLIIWSLHVHQYTMLGEIHSYIMYTIEERCAN